VAIDASGLKDAGEKVTALATVGGPQNQSFLATANATLNASDLGEDLGCVLTWFREGLVLIGPNEPVEALGHMLDRDSDFLSFASAFLKSASTGVDHLEILKEEISNDDPRSVLRNMPLGAVKLTVDNSEALLDREEDHLYQISIQAAHEFEAGKVFRLRLGNESDGTRRLLDLLSALYGPRTKRTVCVIDEIDRSLHPILVKEFLEFFLKSCDGGPRQLIVTTHESNLLDQDLLRRDEIWFAEKDQSASTRLYSLLDFKVRNDLEIRKHYLQGRFGAVPFLGNLHSLVAKTDRPE
jgi:hypothetical protein